MTEITIKYNSVNILNKPEIIDKIFTITIDNNNYIKINTKAELTFNNRLEKFIKDYNAINFLNHYPDEIFMVGDAVNILLDKKIQITDEYLSQLIAQIVIISPRYNEIILNTITKIAETYGFHSFSIHIDVSTITIQFKFEIRPIQFIILDYSVYKNIEQVLEQLTFTHQKIAFNGCNIILNRCAWDAIKTRKTHFMGSIGKYNKLDVYKLLIRDYKIIGVTDNLSQVMTSSNVMNYIQRRYRTFLNYDTITIANLKNIIEKTKITAITDNNILIIQISL
jgi:hypothetical protein